MKPCEWCGAEISHEDCMPGSGWLVLYMMTGLLCGLFLGAVAC